MSRPSVYQEDFNDLAYKFCLLGATDKELATFLGVSKATINGWKKKFPDFFASIKKGKAVADANVAESLYKRACGFEFIEVKTEGILDENTGLPVGKKVTRTTKYVAPDTAAAFIWLKNRQRDKWKDKWEDEAPEEASVADLLKKLADMLPD